MTPELKDMLEKVPRYILIQPDTEFPEYSKVLRDTDEIFNCGEWTPLKPEEWISLKNIVRRPIPEDVREAMAKNMLTNTNAKSETGEYQAVLWPFISWLAGDA